MEAVIMQLCASFVKGQARIKRNKGTGKEFSKKLAEASFRYDFILQSIHLNK
jgi:hypothetical protein